MAALLVGLSVMAVMLAIAMPVWKTAVQREKEAELIFRGQQYARAIRLFQGKYANAFPPNLDILLNERFLRKKYKDPMTKDGEFQLLYAASPAAPGAPQGGTAPQQGRPGMPASAPTPQPSQLDAGAQAPAGARGGIMGVASKSTDSSLRLYNGRSKYNEWAFVNTPATTGISAPAGSQQKPGMPMGPGGKPLGGAPRPGMQPGQPGGGFPPSGMGIGQPGAPRPPMPGSRQRPPN
jgi:type II secretory pathway pseudopilin PulG